MPSPVIVTVDAAMAPDTTVANPTWQSAGSMTKARIEHTMLNLPDGTVLIVGGEDHSDLGSVPSVGIGAIEAQAPRPTRR